MNVYIGIPVSFCLDYLGHPPSPSVKMMTRWAMYCR